MSLKKDQILTSYKLKEELHYDPETGFFTRNKTQRGKGTKGSIVQGALKNGYISICVDYKEYGAHQLAVLYMTGKFSTKLVDHKDRIKTNNKWNNLIEVDCVLNAQNANIRTDNSSGITGVHFSKSAKMWIAQISQAGKRKYLGRYKDFKNAVCARLAGEQCLDWYTGSKISKANQFVNFNILGGE